MFFLCGRSSSKFDSFALLGDEAAKVIEKSRNLSSMRVMKSRNMIMWLDDTMSYESDDISLFFYLQFVFIDGYAHI